MAGNQALVMFTAGFSRRYTGGGREFEIEAKNLRGVIQEKDKLYPGLGLHLEEETIVPIGGAIHETAYVQPIRPGCEVFFIPKLTLSRAVVKSAAATSSPPSSRSQCGLRGCMSWAQRTSGLQLHKRWRSAKGCRRDLRRSARQRRGAP